jgi:glycosyltransferase involved in cell wall biosynthesis
MRPQLEELATSLGIADRITWAGTPVLSELIALYRNNDVFLFPSRIVEGLGVVNCEALACGLPIIGTAHSGSAEVIIPGESGFRIEKDDHEAMGRYLAQFHFERNLLDQFSTNAPKTIQRFAPNNVLDILESELYRVLKNHPKP